MKRLSYFLIVIFIATSCGAGRSGRTVSESGNMVEFGKTGYADLISFIFQGYLCGWESIDPEDQGLSPVYSYCSPYAGFAIEDIDGDGIEELLIGDIFEDGTYALYDIYTIEPDDGSLIHLAVGGERDSFVINEEGIIIETGSNSAFESFKKGFRIKDGALVELVGEDKGWDDSLMMLTLEKFI